MSGCHLRNEEADRDLFLLSRGELSPGRRMQIGFHLLLCSTCRARVAEFKRVSGLLATSFGGGMGPRPPLKPVPILPIGLILLAGLFTTAAFVWSSRPSDKYSRERTAQGGDACRTAPPVTHLPKKLLFRVPSPPSPPPHRG